MDGPEDEDFQYCVKFDFPTTNNVTEYEVLTIGLDLAIRVNTKCLRVFVDSQLVARKLQRDYEARDPFLKQSTKK